MNILVNTINELFGKKTIYTGIVIATVVMVQILIDLVYLQLL